MEIEIKDSDKIKPGQLHERKSPYDMLIEAIKAEGKFYTYPEVCKMLGVSQPTLRKACKSTKVPSKYVQWGKRHVWLFTPDDVREASDLLGGVKIKW